MQVGRQADGQTDSLTVNDNDEEMVQWTRRKEGAEGGVLVVESSVYLQSIYSPRQKQRYSGLFKKDSA